MGVRYVVSLRFHTHAIKTVDQISQKCFNTFAILMVKIAFRYDEHRRSPKAVVTHQTNCNSNYGGVCD